MFEYDPFAMLPRRKMANFLRITPACFDRLVRDGVVPPSRMGRGRQARWPAFVAYYLVFSEYMKLLRDGKPIPPRPVEESASARLVYFIRAGDRVKIGTAAEPLRRLREIQVGNPEVLELLHTMPGKHADERRLHKRFASHRLAGEWFHYADEIQQYVEQLRAG